MKAKVVVQGAPGITRRIVPNSVTRRSTYLGKYPGDLSARGGDGVMGAMDRNAPSSDTPTPATRQMPHKGATSKAQEIAHADPTQGLLTVVQKRVGLGMRRGFD